MTPIRTYFTAEQPTTSLDGIPEEFFRWAEAVHGWTRENLLHLGQTRFVGGNSALNALAYFVGNFAASTAFGKCVFCNDGTDGLTYDALGNLQCIECSSAEYRLQRNKLDLIEAEWIAAGCPDALKLDIASGVLTSWDSLLTRRKTAARHFDRWCKHAARADQSDLFPDPFASALPD